MNSIFGLYNFSDFGFPGFLVTFTNNCCFGSTQINLAAKRVFLGHSSIRALKPSSPSIQARVKVSEKFAKRR